MKIKNVENISGNFIGSAGGDVNIGEIKNKSNSPSSPATNIEIDEIKDVSGNFIGIAGGDVNINQSKQNHLKDINKDYSISASVAKIIGILFAISIILFSIYFK